MEETSTKPSTLQSVVFGKNKQDGGRGALGVCMGYRDGMMFQGTVRNQRKSIHTGVLGAQS
jgi:hypothetical protein